MGNSFKAIPFVRIILPFISGILVCKFFQVNYNTFYFLLPITLMAIFFFAMKHRRDKEIYRRAFVITADIFMILCAMFCCYHYSLLKSTDNYGRYVGVEEVKWKGTVLELPREKENFFRSRLRVEAVENGNTWRKTEGEVVVYFKKPFDNSLIEAGNVLMLQGRFNEIQSPMNPHEFDYKEFMANKNIFYQSFIDPENVRKTDEDTGFDIRLFGLEIKKSIIDVFKNSGLDKDASLLCTALLTGYDEEISPETINAFAHSGTLHVLSVSGLHTGILYGVLLFLFGVFDKHKRLKFTRVITVVLVLFFFALITGFSPPVLRATIMLSLLVVGSSYFSYSSDNAINIMAVSAFGMLFFDPMLLFDVGFLLSYFAIIGIIYFAPSIQHWYNSKYTFANKIWSLCSVSIAAQISTLPLTLYLFHQFPLWFILSNLIVIPLCAALMFLAFLLVLKLNFVKPLITFCSKFVYGCISFTNVKGSGYIDGIDFNGKDALYLSAIIFLLAFFFSNKRFITFRAAILLTLVWQVNSIFDSFTAKSHSALAIYQVNRTSAYELKNRTALLYVSPEKESDHDFHVRPNHSYLNYSDEITGDVDYVKGEKAAFMALDNIGELAVVRLLQPDYILVKGSVDLEESMISKLKTKLLIADGSNTYKQVKELRRLCGNFGIAFYSTRENGYLELDLNK